MTASMSAARPTRRAMVRGAAWSVPVVAIAATAPAFAASLAASTMTATTPDKWGNAGYFHVSWDLSLKNGPVAIQSLSLTFTYVPNGGGTFETFLIYGYNPSDNSWVPSAATTVAPYTVSATHGSIAANAVANIHVDFAGAENSSGAVSAVATILYVNGATSSPTVGPVSWRPGSQHAH